MRLRSAILLIGSVAVICLADGCATSHKRSAATTCCSTNLQAVTPQVPMLPNDSIYQIDATWTTDAGQPFKLSALSGRPQIVAMFFTSCQNACPITVTDMKRIEAALPEGLRGRVGFTLVSFDPERDTVAALHAYRLRRDLDPARWTMLRGEPANVAELAARLGMKWRPGARGQFGHSNIITLLNPAGEIVRQQIGLNQSIEQTVVMVQEMASR